MTSSWASSMRPRRGVSWTRCVNGWENSPCRCIRTRPASSSSAALRRRAQRRGLGKPETFAFLGFTHICDMSRAGKFLVKRKTRSDRMGARLKAIKEGLRRRMHLPIPAQGRWLRQVVTGYFNYHAVPLNSVALEAFRTQTVGHWLQTLRRRSQKDRFSWERIKKLAAVWLPKPKILHPWPRERFVLRHPRWEPYAGKPHVRICAGGAQQ